MSGRGRMILGVDPGVTGAAALIEGDGALVAVADLGVDAVSVADVLRSLLARVGAAHHVFGVVEKAQAMPRQGVSSTFRTGQAFGHVEAVLAVLAVPVWTVSPASWKRQMGLTTDKARSLSLARQLFPLADLQRKKDHNRAEALLLAEWRRRQA